MYLRIFCSFLVVTMTTVAADDEDYLIVLNDGDFEHKTQISTGMTTGDWLVFMAPKGECSKCGKIEEIFKKVALEYRGRINIAKLDRDESRLTLRRFDIRTPVIKFFRSGYQWEYKGMIAKSNLGDFITSGYQQQNGYRAPKPIDFLDAWQEDFVKEIKAAYKERRLPERDALIVAIAGALVALLILVCVLAPKTKKGDDGDETPRRNKQQSKKKK